MMVKILFQCIIRSSTARFLRLDRQQVRDTSFAMDLISSTRHSVLRCRKASVMRIVVALVSGN